MMITNLMFWSTTFFWKLGMTINDNLNGFDYMIPRSMALLAWSVWDMIYFKANPCNVNRKGLILLIMRSVIAACGFPWYFISLKYIPMSKASIIVNLAPMIVPIFAYFALKEKVTIIDIISLIFGFLGWAMINLTSLNNSRNNTHENMQFIGFILWIIALIARVLVPITLRLLSTQINPIYPPIYLSFGVCISSIISYASFSSSFNFDKWSFNSILWFLISGVCNYWEQRLMTYAYKFSKATILTPITY